MVHRNDQCWLIEQPLLDSISFAGLHFLIDADRYLEKIHTKLGFPVFLGRVAILTARSAAAVVMPFGSTPGVMRWLPTLLRPSSPISCTQRAFHPALWALAFARQSVS